MQGFMHLKFYLLEISTGTKYLKTSYVAVFFLHYLILQTIKVVLHPKLKLGIFCMLSQKY